MNILYIGNRIYGGGAENIFRLTYKKLKISNKNTFIGTTDGKGDVNFLSSSEEHGFFLKNINLIFNYKNYKALDCFLSENNIEIVHVHNYIPEISLSIFLALRKHKNIKIVQTLHQFDLACPNGSLCDINKKKICEKCIGKKIKWRILVNKCNAKGLINSVGKFMVSLFKELILYKKLVDVFIVPSDFSKEKLIQEGLNSQKICVINNFIENVFFEDKKLVNKEDIIVYYGRFSKEKNVIALLKAFVKVLKVKPNAKLFLIGEGEEINEYYKIINENEIGEAVVFFSFADSMKLIEIISRAKISVLPSVCYETFGLTLIESIALRIIPIGTDIGSIKENIENTIGYLFRYNDVEDLSNKLIDGLINYGNKMKDLEKVKEKIELRFSERVYEEKLLHLYNEILGEKNEF